MRVRSQQDFLAGLFFILVAVSALGIGSDYPAGTAIRMGAGYFPRLVSSLLAGLGTILVSRSLHRDGKPLEPLVMRPLVVIPAVVVGFGVGIDYVGFVAATFLMVLVASGVQLGTRWGEALLTAALLAGAASVIFIWGVGLPIPLWPEF
jgi:hypothetical protein